MILLLSALMGAKSVAYPQPPYHPTIACSPSGKLILYFNIFPKDSSLFIADDFQSVNNDVRIKLEKLRFYVSRIRLFSAQKLVFSDNARCHLIDALMPATCQMDLNVPEDIHFDRLVFDVGVDSVTNISGALEGDLDPLQGMYWTWQSGYINIKLEGIRPAAPDGEHDFKFHIGGYRYPYNALASVQLEISGDSKSEVLELGFDFNVFFKGMDWKRNQHIMSPGTEAVLLAQKFASSFRIMKP